MAGRIALRHPQKGKKGVSIDRTTDAAVRGALIDVLQRRGEMTFENLLAALRRRLRGKICGSVDWYATWVKLDLESRKVVEHVPGAQPQRLRLRKS